MLSCGFYSFYIRFSLLNNIGTNFIILFGFGQVLCDNLIVSPDCIGKVTDFEGSNYAKLTKLHFMDDIC